MKILIVDDSALARRLIIKMLEEHARGIAYEIAEAQNGADAHRQLAENGADLIFVDWNMPILDGLSFVKELRMRGLKLPIVMITALSDEAGIHEAIAAGVTDYIEKPFQSVDLWNRVKALMS